MFTIEECVYLLASGLVSEMYVPEEYLHDPHVLDAMHRFLWMTIPSHLVGWVVVRRRVVYQD